MPLDEKYCPLALLEILRFSQTCYYMCSMHLAPSWGRILKLVCLLSILQHTRPSAHHLLFSQRWWHISNLWSLTGLQIWACFLCMFTSHPLKLPFAYCLQNHAQGFCQIREAVWVSHIRCWGCPAHGPIRGIHRWGFLSTVWVGFLIEWVGFLIEFIMQLIGPSVSLMPSESYVSLPQTFPTLQHLVL